MNTGPYQDKSNEMAQLNHSLPTMAIATFGIYTGNDVNIYKQQIYQ